MLDRTNSREERFTLSHGFRSLCSIMERRPRGVCQIKGTKQRPLKIVVQKKWKWSRNQEPASKPQKPAPVFGCICSYACFPNVLLLRTIRTLARDPAFQLYNIFKPLVKHLSVWHVTSCHNDAFSHTISYTLVPLFSGDERQLWSWCYLSHWGKYQEMWVKSWGFKIITLILRYLKNPKLVGSFFPLFY